MSTGGYDVVLQIHEGILNRFLSISHCMGLFRSLTGSYTLPIRDVPEELREFMVIGYEVSLAGVPSLDFTDELNVLLGARGQVKFTVLGGIEFELEVQFRVGVNPSYDQGTSRVSIDFVEAAIEEVELNDVFHLPDDVLERLNEILAIAMEEYLTAEVTNLPISPVLFDLALPFMPSGLENRLTIGMGSIHTLTPTVFSSAFNLLGYMGGDRNAVTDLTEGSHIGVGISEQAMHRVYDFWWLRTTHPKAVTLTGVHDFDLGGWDEWIEAFGEWSIAWLTGGIVTEDVEITRVYAEYGATFRFSKFDFDLREDGTVTLSGNVNADLWLRFLIDTETTTRLFFIEIDSDTDEVNPFDVSITRLPIEIESAEGRVYLDDDNQLKVDLTSVDVNFDLPWELPEFLLNYITGWAVNAALDSLPPIMLSPSVVSSGVPGTEMTVGVTITGLNVSDREAVVSANVEPSGLETYAPYVGNTDSMEVHLRDCEYGRMIRIDRREWFCDLEGAFRVGYDGCYYCLPEYHHH